MRLALLLLLPVTLSAQQRPTPDAARWWQLTTELANDSMQGRDTGSEAYERAAKLVAAHLAAAGLRPAGDHGTYFQRVPMHQTDLDTTRSSINLLTDFSSAPGGTPHRTRLRILEDVTLAPRPFTQTTVIAPMVFAGYGLPVPERAGKDVKEFHGAAAVIFNSTPAGLSDEERSSFSARRVRALGDAGFSTILAIDNPSATEPFHWPAAYARTVVLGDGRPTSGQSASPLLIRISAEAAAQLFTQDPNHSWPALLKIGQSGAPLPSFHLHTGIAAEIATRDKDISSPNILAILPGSDPKLAPEYVALSAHLDGYGFGTPVDGDSLYNGALDDAAYVATLLELAQNLHGKAPARSLLVCIFTGEEKGLLGSQFFTQHPTVPVAQIVADLNLDQLRPIFPLHALTMEGLTDSTLGDTARAAAAPFHIELRGDREPERNLFRRADNYNFVRAGIPIASFIFGYDPGSPEERIYRDWYARRYHKPQDDLSTPIDWNAAVTFNRFYQALTLAIANAPSRPAWSPSSFYAPPPPRGPGPCSPAGACH